MQDVGCLGLVHSSYFMGFPGSSADKESTCNAGDTSSIPGSGRFTGEEIVYRLQYSWASLVTQLVKNHLQCGRPGFDSWVGKIPWRRERLPTPIFWPEEFHGVAESWTWLSDFHLYFDSFHFHLYDWVTFTCILIAFTFTYILIATSVYLVAKFPSFF